jgi:hypothetical protein
LSLQGALFGLRSGCGHFGLHSVRRSQGFLMGVANASAVFNCRFCPQEKITGSIGVNKPTVWKISSCDKKNEPRTQDLIYRLSNAYMQVLEFFYFDLLLETVCLNMAGDGMTGPLAMPPDRETSSDNCRVASV